KIEEFLGTAEVCRQWADRVVVAKGLSSSQFRALGVLIENESMKQNAIARALSKTDGNVTVVIENLHKRGLVQRERNDSDRRVVLIRATEKGKGVYKELLPIYQERLNQAIESMSAEDFNAMERLTHRLRAAMAREGKATADLPVGERG
ncbi:MAG: MarR family winged helix-turn-helix transcriptional regulator, partial [Fimbriimonadaceae bacterium]